MKKLDLEYLDIRDGYKFSWIAIPLALITEPEFNDLSPNAKILYALMINRAGLSAKNHEKYTDEDGRIYITYTGKSIARNLSCSERTARRLKKELLEIGLIEIDKSNFESSKIYVKDFSSIFRNRENKNNDNCSVNYQMNKNSDNIQQKILSEDKNVLRWDDKYDLRQEDKNVLHSYINNNYIDDKYNIYPSKKKRECIKNAYGVHKNLFMTEDEHTKLLNIYEKKDIEQFMDTISIKILIKHEPPRNAYKYILKAAINEGIKTKEEKSKLKKEKNIKLKEYKKQKALNLSLEGVYPDHKLVTKGIITESEYQNFTENANLKRYGKKTAPKSVFEKIPKELCARYIILKKAHGEEKALKIIEELKKSQEREGELHG